MTKLRSRVPASLLAIGLLAAALPPAVAGTAAQAETGEILETFVLPDVPLAEVQNPLLPESPIADDRGFLLGGIGSDLWRAPEDPPDEFWMVTDRGPNGQIEVDGRNRRTFPVPEFTPHILHVRTADAAIEILEAIPLVGQSGEPLTGLSNLADIDETPWDAAAEVELSLNPNGLDTEGLVRTANGAFWLVDEYRPSIVHADASGRVIARYVPEGVALVGADYEVVDSLPALFAMRKNNRGFEGLALSPDQTTLFATLQSPLSNPDGDSGETSRQTRILAFDIASGQPVAEYAYVFEEATEFDPNPEVVRDDMKLSGIVAIDADTLLILERTDEVAKLHTVETGGATNLLGGAFDDPATDPSLEAAEDAAAAGVTPLPKSLLIDLSTMEGMSEKIEGVAIVDATTVAVANDNDFDVGELDAEGLNVGDGTPSMILIVRTPPIPGLDGDAARPQSGATTASSAAAAAPAQVEIVADDYEPGVVTVPVGATVRWVNRDGVTHTVSAFDRSFDSGPMHRGGVYSHTFHEPGRYEYGCDLHLEMLGRVSVVEG